MLKVKLVVRSGTGAAIDSDTDGMSISTSTQDSPRPRSEVLMPVSPLTMSVSISFLSARSSPSIASALLCTSGRIDMNSLTMSRRLCLSESFPAEFEDARSSSIDSAYCP